MTRSVKRRQRVDTEAFFAGVADVRAYLDRNLQDPEHRLGRLSRLVEGLVRQRGARELGQWLTSEVCAALGARGCSLLLRDGVWQPWLAAGHVTVPERPAPDSDGGVFIPLAGADEVSAALWIEGCGALDCATQALLQAIADTAGVILERERKMEAIRCDPLTGLTGESGFVQSARASLSDFGPGQAAALVAFRVMSLVDLRQAYGQRAVQAALVHLARAARGANPPAALLGIRFEDVLALVGPSSAERIERVAATFAQTVQLELRRASADPGPPLSASAVYCLTSRSLDDVARLVQTLGRALDQTTAGGLRRLE